MPHTVTVYARQVRRGPDLTETALCHKTVLRGVLLEESRGVAQAAGGPLSDNEARLFIPFGAEAQDADTGAARRYVSPEAFHRAEDRSGLWTLEPAAGCFFLRGEHREEKDFMQLRREAGAYRVTDVKIRDFGGAGLRHFQVLGR